MRNATIILFIIFFVISIGNVYSQDVPKFGGTLRIGLRSDITTHYPWEIRDMETLMAMENVYEPLVRLKKEIADTEPGLATEWTPSKDFKKWIFKLRRNVKFHDGSVFNADSAIETLSVSKILNASMRKIDDYTIEFNLDTPNAAFPISLSVEYYGIASEKTVKCFKENCKDFVAGGTGAFIINKWEPGKQIVLVANNNYWGGRPYLDKVIFLIYKNSEEAIKALVDRRIDFILGLSPNNIEEVKKYKYLIFQSKSALSTGFIGFNAAKPPFNNKMVRKAIAHAIDKKFIVNKYFYAGQTASVANNWLPPAMFGYDKDIPEIEYNLNKAKELLAKAGFPNGFQTSLLPPPVARSTLPEPYEMADDIISQLAKIGIDAKVMKVNSWKEYLDRAFSGNYDLILFGWVADTIDPNDFLTSLFSKSTINFTNLSRWYNAEFEKVLDQARASNVGTRLKLYKKAQMILYEEMPVIPLVNAMQLAAWNERVKGYKMHPAARLYLNYIWLSD